MKIFFILFTFLSFFGLSACSHFVRVSQPDVESQSKLPHYSISHKDISSKKAYQSLKSTQYTSSYGEIPIDKHSDVDKWIDYFTNTDLGRERMQTYLERSSRYIALMKSVLKENNLPLDLVYVALIESGFSPRALSRANAVGYWQFIYGTGKRFGLRIDGYVDERRDPVLSTRAAANYFKELYSLFESWHLALAAYNAGEYRVHRILIRYYSRNFWFLSSKNAFPRETRNYVPKLMAAIRISRDPGKYGFSSLNYQAPIAYELLKVTKPVSLVRLAKHMQIDIKEIKALNPIYKGEYVPVYEEGFTTVRVPVGKLSLAQASLDKSWMSQPKLGYSYHYWYRVRRGDSLYKIARRHKTTISKIQRLNNLSSRSSFLRIGQKLKIPTKKLLTARKKSSASNRRTASVKSDFHTVRKGQTLSYIARLYGLKLDNLKRLNNMHGNPLIHPRQKLRIRKESSVKAESYHVVKRGDTLIGISKKYGIPLPKLMEVNSMSLKSILLTGTRLILPKKK